MTFTELNLNNPLLNALHDMGLTEPTPIQQKAFPVIMSGKDVLGIAQTGTGKTLAFLLPILRMWKFSKSPNPQILILVPTRELVVQLVQVINNLSEYTNLVVRGVYGGVNMKTQAYEISDGMDIIVATPGRLIDLALEGFITLKGIKKLVLDEVDEMLDLGFRHQLKSILDMLPERRQNLLFSATVTEDVQDLVNTFFNFPEVIQAAPTGTPLDNIIQVGYDVPNYHTKVNLLHLLLQENSDMSRVLVFTATKKMADAVYLEITERAENPDDITVIHSDKAQNLRFRTVREFHEGKFRVLIATDLISRGLDISEVSHVINFDLPDNPESYIHRIGRTGRADKTGDAISFITPKDEDYQADIEALMNREIPMAQLPESLEISDIISDFDKVAPKMKNVLVKIAVKKNVGKAFHDKKDKNKKVNNKVRRIDKMKAKYGKPKTRGQKKK